MDLAGWMSKLPAAKRQLPLNHLVIPGSHDSFTSSLNPSSSISDDTPEAVRCAGQCFPIKPIIYKWCLTQRASAKQQLELGIRYFDIRLSIPEGTTEMRICHGLHGDLIEDVLLQILEFLTDYQEVVLLDFNHFYNFNEEDHKRLISLITTLFDAKLCPPQAIDHVCLDSLQTAGQQALLFYQAADHLLPGLPVWSRRDISAPWANTDKLERLIPFLTDALKHRSPGFFVTQGVVTPKEGDLVAKMCGSLEPMATRATEAVIEWVKTEHSSLDLNVVICDFVGKFEFCRALVALNFV